MGKSPYGCTGKRMLEIIARGYTAGARATDTQERFCVGIFQGGLEKRPNSRRTNEFAWLGSDG